MIFLSYSHKDKETVSQIAEVLSKSFGDHHVFFDQWSIQPGDSIVDRMNNGLADCKFFFFFFSKNSLSSKMVGLEWKNALIKHIRGDTKFIPVKLDDCDIPEILLQNLYINLYGNGMEFALRQMIDVANERNTYREGELTGFQNVRAYVTGTEFEITVEFRAESYSEPQSKYLLLVNVEHNNFQVSAPKEALYEHGIHLKHTLDSGGEFNVISIGRSGATSPGFPFIVQLLSLNGKPLPLYGAMRAKSAAVFNAIPMIDCRQSLCSVTTP